MTPEAGAVGMQGTVGPHWPEPEPGLCPKCGAAGSGYFVGGWRFCISPKCDPHGKQWAALNTWYMQAAKLAMGLQP